MSENNRTEVLAGLRYMLNELDATNNKIRTAWFLRYPIPPEVDAILEFRDFAFAYARSGAFKQAGRMSSVCSALSVTSEANARLSVANALLEKKLDLMTNLLEETTRQLNERRAAKPSAEWKPIGTAPNDRSVLLGSINMIVPVYAGRYRTGNLGEPQPSVRAWRCDSSGRFASPTHWAPLLDSPVK